MLAFRDFQLLKLEYDKLLSNFGFDCNVCLYNEEEHTKFASLQEQLAHRASVGRCRLTPGLHS